MPNWCDCELMITGDANELKKFRKFAQTGKGDTKNVLDTNQFIPYPKKFARLDKKADKHNKKRASLTDEEQKNSEHMTDGFSSGGIDWCRENWGTKWGICGATINSEDYSYGLEYVFVTAWSPAKPVIAKMSKMFPKLRFDLRYFESQRRHNGLLVCKQGTIVENTTGEYFGHRGG